MADKKRRTPISSQLSKVYIGIVGNILFHEGEIRSFGLRVDLHHTPEEMD